MTAALAVHAPLYLSDEQLEHYGRIYRRLPESWRAAHSFGYFLSRVPQLRAQLASHSAPRSAYASLSSRERLQLRDALERSIEVIDNGRRIEKLKHHRHPRGPQRFMKPAP